MIVETAMPGRPTYTVGLNGFLSPPFPTAAAAAAAAADAAAEAVAAIEAEERTLRFSALDFN